MMLLQKLFPSLLPSETHDRQLDRARARHHQLSKTQHDKFRQIADRDYKLAANIAQERYAEMAQMLRARVKEYYSSAEQNKINSTLICLIDILASKAHIFPDMDCQNIWYTDHFDLIELARNMGVGDETLPHWETESNDNSRYLEIKASDLVQMLLDLAAEAAIDPYHSGNNVHRWFRYIARETLKSRQRISRYRRQQSETLWVSASMLGREGWDRN